jgi:hypothetical protein
MRIRRCQFEALEQRTLFSVVPNLAPAVVEDHYQFLTGTTSTSSPGVLANDRDPEGSALSASLLMGTRNGVLQLKSNGTFTYRPNAGFTGSDVFVYRATDAVGKQTVGVAEIEVVAKSPTTPPTTPTTPQPPTQQGVFNVRNYGAKGDAATDDTLAIRAAIAAAEKAGGGTVYFPPGTYVVSPQPSDPDWPDLSDPNWLKTSVHQAIFHIDQSNIQFKGDGAGQSTISVKTIDPVTGKTGADPNKAWMVVPLEGREAIFRGVAFRLGNPDKALTNISFTGLRITGNTVASADRSVGGNPETGTGWDMSHKAIVTDSAFPVNLTIEDCRLDGWRGEVIYAGGTAASKITIRRSLIEESNGSAVATSAFTTIEDSTIRNVYNGTENYCVGKGQGLVVRNTTFEITREGAWSHGIVYEGTQGLGTSMVVENSTFKNYPRGIYIVGGAENATVTGSKFLVDKSGIYVGAQGSGKVFKNLKFTNNQFDMTGGMAILLHTYGAPTSNVLIEGNTASGGSFISDTGSNRTGLIVRNNKISTNIIYRLEASGVDRGLWSNNQYIYTNELWKHFKALTDRTDVTAGKATISPSREQFGVQLLGGGDVTLSINTAENYPVGYTVKITRYGAQSGTIRIAPASWNTLTKAVTVTTQGVTLRKLSTGKFELVT